MTTSTTHELYRCETIIRDHLLSLKDNIVINGTSYSLPSNTQFVSVSEMRSFLHILSTSPWIMMRYGFNPPVKLSISPALKVKCYYSAFPTPTITMSKQSWSANKLTLVHEYAHHIIHSRGGCHGDSHGDEFFEVYLQLISDHISTDLSLALSALVKG